MIFGYSCGAAMISPQLWTRGHSQVSGAFTVAAPIIFSLQTALNLQNLQAQQLLKSYANSLCLHLLRYRDGHSCIIQRHLFARLSSWRQEGATDDAVLV